MIPQSQLNELQKLHKDHIANTFLFTSKILDQRRRISDAQAEVIHGLLRDLAANAGHQEPGQDPVAAAQNAMRQISEGLASASTRSGDLFKETAAAYAEILRLAMGYSADTFTGMQTAARDAGRVRAPATAVSNPWMESFMNSFESAADMMNSSFRPLVEAAETSARAMGRNGKARTTRKTPH